MPPWNDINRQHKNIYTGGTVERLVHARIAGTENFLFYITLWYAMPFNNHKDDILFHAQTKLFCET